jgi:glycosyltransferase involved in cell wall biosynthesis
MKGDVMPLVSVCIPTFNYARFLPEAISSVLNQTFRNFELLVVDNCSTDGTDRVVEQFARREPRLRYFRNACNLGICRNFNRALEVASGDYVKILCADDWLAPRALEKSVAALSRHVEAALVTTGRVLVSESGEQMGFESYCREPQVTGGHAVINRCFFGTNYVGEPSAVLFRRHLASRGFDEHFPQIMDMEMWFHLLEQGALACVPEPLTMIRMHHGQLTRANMDAGHIVADKKRLFPIYAGKPYLKKNRWNVFVWKLRIAYNLWCATRQSNTRAHGSVVGEFVQPVVFYLLLPILFSMDKLRNVTRRLRRFSMHDTR